MLMKPKIDFAFKLLFGSDNQRSRTLLIDLLNAILGLKGSKRITSVVHLDPYLNKEYESDKMSIMDIEVRTDAGELIDIEMQIGNVDDYRKRTLYYWAKMYAKDISEGDPYRLLTRCVVINILNFRLFNETKKYHNTFAALEIEEGFKLNNDLELHYLELPKLTEIENINNMDDLERWLLFIKEAGEEGKEEIVQKLRQESEVIDMAVKILEEMSEDERIRQEYFYREKAARDKASQAAYMKEKEEEAAKAQEEAAKAQEKTVKAQEVIKKTVIGLANKGLTVKEISDITGMTVEEIEGLLK